MKDNKLIMAKSTPYTRLGKKNPEHPIHAKNAAERAATKARQKISADARDAKTARVKAAATDARQKKAAASKTANEKAADAKVAGNKVAAEKREDAAAKRPFTRLGKKNPEYKTRKK